MGEVLTPVAEVELRTCWNEIGVRGDGTCPELPRVIHCRNCPVYSSAGAQMLNRPLPAEYRMEWTEHFARKKRTAAPARISAVLFRINSEWLALPTQVFQEVSERRSIHSLPHRRSGVVLGLVNIRGELLIGISLGRFLGIEKGSGPLPHGAKFDRLLVINRTGSRMAFPVDEVHGIVRFESQELKDPPATVARSGINFTQGVISWRGTTVGFLNSANLFSALDRSLT